MAALAERYRATRTATRLAQNLPGGFTPGMRGNVEDWSIAFGLRGTGAAAPLLLLDGWNYDMSAVFGQHRTTYVVRNTVNPQLIRLGDAMPTTYFGRAYEERDKIFNLDLSRLFDTGLFYSPLNVAFGLEYREEEYEIESGEKNGWCIDDQGECDGQRPRRMVSTSQGFRHRRPSLSRHSAGECRERPTGTALVRISTWRPMSSGSVLLTAAGRFEHHEGVGESLDGKLAGRWERDRRLPGRYAARWAPAFAPRPWGRSNYRDTTFGLCTMHGGAVDRAAHAAGAATRLPNKRGPSRSSPRPAFSFSIGTILTLSELSVTLDYYNMEVRNRIGLDRKRQSDHRCTISPPWRRRGVDASRVGSDDRQVLCQRVRDLHPRASIWWQPTPWNLFDGRFGTTLLTFAGNWNDTKLNLDSIDSRRSSMRCARSPGSNRRSGAGIPLLADGGSHLRTVAVPVAAAVL